MPGRSHPHHAEGEQHDLYADLGVAEGATDAEIRRAYRELVLKVHPDKQGDAAEFRKVHEAYEVLRDPVKRGQYDARRSNGGGWVDENDYEYTDDSEPEFGTHFHNPWADFLRHMQASARAHREYEARMEKERAARADEEKRQRMEREEAARENTIAQEDRRHEKHTKTNKKAKQAASRKNCTCEGCRDRFVREHSEQDQKRNDPKGYDERMKIREAVAARKEQETAKQAQEDAERDAQEQRAEEEMKMFQEKAAAEQATRERLLLQLAEQEARKKAKEQAAAEEIANRRRLEQLAQREAKEAAERKADKDRKAAERKAKEAAELEARKAAERAAAEEAHRLAEQEAREAARREAAERKAKESAERAAKEAEEQKLNEAAQREAKESAERRAQEAAEQKATETVLREAQDAIKRKAKDIAEREAMKAAALKALDEARRKGKESGAWEPKKQEERVAQEIEELDFGEAEERAATEKVAQEQTKVAQAPAQQAKITTQQQTPMRLSFHDHVALTEALQHERYLFGQPLCRYAIECKNLANGKCSLTHLDYETVRPALGVKPLPPGPAKPQPTPVVNTKPTERTTQPPQAQGDRRSKVRCFFKKKCRNLPEGKCVYHHTDAELALFSKSPGATQTQGPGVSQPTPQPASDASHAATTQDSPPPPLFPSLTPAARLRIANTYIQSAKDCAILSLLAEGKHVPPAGVPVRLSWVTGLAVGLGWITTGYAGVCDFCGFDDGSGLSYRCVRGGAVACWRCTTELGKLSVEDEGVLFRGE